MLIEDEHGLWGIRRVQHQHVKAQRELLLWAQDKEVGYSKRALGNSGAAR